MALFHQRFLCHRFPMFLISYHGYGFGYRSSRQLHAVLLRASPAVRTNLYKALRIKLVCLFLIFFFMEGLQIQGKRWGGEVEPIGHMLVYYQAFPSHPHCEHKFWIWSKPRRHVPRRWLSLGDFSDRFLPLPTMLTTSQCNCLLAVCLSSPLP